jgi:hypothetical protein
MGSFDGVSDDGVRRDDNVIESLKMDRGLMSKDKRSAQGFHAIWAAMKEVGEN